MTDRRGGLVVNPAPSVYSGLRLLPAALVLLEIDDDPIARRAVVIEGADVEGMPEGWVGDAVTVDWDRLLDRARRSSTKVRLAELARSMLDGTPVTLQILNCFEHSTWGLIMHALARSWPAPPPSVDHLLDGDRPVDPDAIERRRLGVDPGPPWE